MLDSLHCTWVEQATRGDRQAIGKLLELHLPALLAYMRLHAGSLLRSRESCADLVQSLCADVLAELGSFEYRSIAAFRKWLFLKAHNKLVDRRRHHEADRRNPIHEVHSLNFSTATGLDRLYSTMLTPIRAAIENERIARFEAAFDQLPEDYRDVITLSRLCGMSRDEVATDMGRSPAAVRQLLHRALARLGLLIRQMSHGETEA